MEVGAAVSLHVVTPHKPSTRRLTNARREQNRRAQNKFRARRKARQDLAQDLAGTSILANKDVGAATSPPPNVEQPYKRISNSGSHGGFNQHKSPVSRLHAAWHANTIDEWSKGGSGQDPFDRQRLNRESWPPLETDTEDSVVRILKSLAPAVLFPADPNAVDMRAMWLIPMKCYQEVYSPPQSSTRNVQHHSSWASTCHWNISPERTTTASRFSPAPSRSFDSGNSEAILPCPRRNYIQLMGESCFAATMAIASCLGITRSAYINDHPSLFPLNSSNILSSGLQTSQLAPDLQPTPEQKTLAHPNFLDCIIFPRFRSRAIEMSSRGELDLCSLFLDLMHDGLVCWVSQSVVRDQAGSGVHTACRSTRGGVPWDRRSWEARPWFLRKWGSLVGDDDADGMRSNSEWWQCIRGDVDADCGDDLQSRESLVEDQGAVFSRHGGCNVGIRQTVENDLLVIWNGEQWALNKDLA